MRAEDNATHTSLDQYTAVLHAVRHAATTERPEDVRLSAGMAGAVRARNAGAGIDAHFDQTADAIAGILAMHLPSAAVEHVGAVLQDLGDFIANAENTDDLPTILVLIGRELRSAGGAQ